LVEGEEFKDAEDFIPMAIGLAGEGVNLVADAFHLAALSRRSHRLRMPLA
jgi:hypothetical protein